MGTSQEKRPFGILLQKRNSLEMFSVYTVKTEDISELLKNLPLIIFQ
jgi:hypothetical protein